MRRGIQTRGLSGSSLADSATCEVSARTSIAISTAVGRQRSDELRPDRVRAVRQARVASARAVEAFEPAPHGAAREDRPSGFAPSLIGGRSNASEHERLRGMKPCRRFTNSRGMSGAPGDSSQTSIEKCFTTDPLPSAQPTAEPAARAGRARSRRSSPFQVGGSVGDLRSTSMGVAKAAPGSAGRPGRDRRQESSPSGARGTRHRPMLFPALPAPPRARRVAPEACAPASPAVAAMPRSHRPGDRYGAEPLIHSIANRNSSARGKRRAHAVSWWTAPSSTTSRARSGRSPCAANAVRSTSMPRS